MIMNCAIIGSTKIAEIHAKHIINNGVKEITFISRSQNKRKKKYFKPKKNLFKSSKFFSLRFKNIKKEKI